MKLAPAFCEDGGVGFSEACLSSVASVLLYVGALYMPWSAGDRDRPSVIFARIISVSVVAVAGEAYVRMRVPVLSAYISVSAAVAGIVSATVLTALLYTGHFIARMDGTTASHREAFSLLDRETRVLAIRNYIAAPLLEEIVFRRHNLVLWSCLPESWQIVCPAAFFSLAHIHHIQQQNIAIVMLQLVYTFLFGIYASTLFLRTGSLFAPVTAHIICNFLEVPDVGAITQHKHSKLIIAVNLSAIAIIAISFPILTNWAGNKAFT